MKYNEYRKRRNSKLESNEHTYDERDRPKPTRSPLLQESRSRNIKGTENQRLRKKLMNQYICLDRVTRWIKQNLLIIQIQTEQRKS